MDSVQDAKTALPYSGQYFVLLHHLSVVLNILGKAQPCAQLHLQTHLLLLRVTAIIASVASALDGAELVAISEPLTLTIL